MKSGTLLVMTGLAVALTSASGASAQAAGALLAATTDREVTVSSAAALLDDEVVNARLASADRALKRGSEARARAMYEAIASDLRAADRLPTTAVWRLAGMEYSSGAPLKAASILDALASEAAAAGDVTVEIMALFEAAHVYAIEGHASKAEDRLDRGGRLLGASELPAVTRVALLKKVRG